MSELEDFRSPIVRNGALHSRVIEQPVKPLASEPQIYCVYNQSRQQFLCTHAQVSDLSPEDLYEPLARISPDSSTALWLTSFRGISANEVSSPIDLVFLDRNNCVLAVVESFPISQPTTSNWPSGSALILPAQTIATSGTLAGDHLILCSPEKVNRRLHNLQDNGEGIQENVLPSTHSRGISHEFPGARRPWVRMTTWEEVLHPLRPAHHNSASAPASVSKAKPSDPALRTTRATINWLVCWLTLRPRDSRKSMRKFLPWVAAYFFNGGVPSPTSVRNISMNGMFVSTSERWNLGTIVRVTLSDWRLPSPDHTITMNAMAVRWGDDGVGLRFVFNEPSRSRPYTSDPQLAEVTRKQLKEFLEQFKGRNYKPANPRRRKESYSLPKSLLFKTPPTPIP